MESGRATKEGGYQPKEAGVRRGRSRVPAIRRSLAFMLQSMQVIELKNDTEVTGVIDEVDAAMNVSVVGAVHKLTDGTALESETMTVKGANIRYVHIPPKLRMRAQVADYLKRIERIHQHSKPHQIKDRPKLIAPEPADRSDIILS